MAKHKYARKRMLKQARATSIQDCELATHTKNVLEAAGLKTKADIIFMDEEALNKIPGIGEKAMEGIRNIKNAGKAE